MVKEHLLTAAGMEKLEEELRHLETVERPEVIERIREAKSFGDLSENSEYDEAKKAQGMCEGRIIEITQILDNAEVVEVPKRVTKVGIGTAVEILDMDTKKKLEFKIVGSAECDPMKMEISDMSPVGSALLGHKKGDVIAATTPAGIKNFEILAIKAIKR